MSEAPLMNDEQARSPTGEILDQSTSTQPTTPNSDQSASPSTTDSTSSTTQTEQPPSPEPKPPSSDQSKAPDAYAEFKAPDGYTLDKAAIEAFAPIAKELGLSQEAAQRLVDFHTKSMIDAAKAPQSTYESMRQDWRAKTEADLDMKAYATDGKTGLDAVKVDIGRALGALGDLALVADFKSAMDITGAGDHPAFVKAMWRLAQKIGEGKPVAGKGPSPLGQSAPDAKPASAAKSLYPNLA